MNALGKFVVIFIGVCLVVAVASEFNKRAPQKLPGYVGGDPNQKHEVWSYATSADEMSGKTVRQARIASSNAFDLKQPYQGEQHAILVLRQHGRLGNDVIFQVSKGQLICDYRACRVTVRFDDDPPVEWPASHPADNDTTTLFLGNYDHFLAKLNHSKRLRIEPTFYQNGSPLIEFPTAGFDRAKYEGNK